MKQKKEERTPILYEKFKKDTEEKVEEVVSPVFKVKKSLFQRLADLLLILFLLGLIFLAGVGTLTLVNPMMRGAFWEYFMLRT